jgi:phage repressor protein C with HTH and peptisase S24 domain
MEITEIYAADILERMLSVAGMKRDSQLATLLGVSPQAICQARKKDKVPESWLIRMAARYRLSVDWLLSGHDGHAPENAPPNSPVAFTGVRTGVARASGAPDGDVDFVPLVAASLSAGKGSLDTGGEILDRFAFRRDWLSARGNPDSMILMNVHGDSMEPVICHGDMVLIDQGKTRIYGHAVYAVGVNEEIYVKQVETLPGNRMILRSINERYAPVEVDLRGDLADSVRIIGKIIWWCREA